MGRWLAKFVEIRPGETRCLVWSFVWFFLLMFGYYILRPVRESLTSVAGSEHLNVLFAVVFVVMLVVINSVSRVYFKPFSQRSVRAGTRLR